jgi:glycosyltransferase involved in cell wall biosynthesis
MRLLFVIYGSLRQISGGYLYDRKVIEHLEGMGIRVDCLELPACPYLLCLLHYFSAPLRQLFAGAEAGRYDCIVIDELTHPSVFLSVSRRRPSGPPVVVLLHHLKIRERIGALMRTFARAMERRLLRSADAVIVNSRTTGATVRELTDSRTAVYVCPPGSDTFTQSVTGGAIPAAANSNRPVRLLTTGNIIPRKGHDLLIRLLSELSQLPWQLRVVGAAVDPRYRRRLDRMGRKYELADRIVYTGVLSGDALSKEYRAADVFVFPSRYEGFGISLAEAIRAGLPFIAFASGAIPEVTGGRGLLMPEGDPQSFQKHLKRLIREPEFRRQTAATSRAMAADLPTWRQTGERFLQAIQEILSEGINESGGTKTAKS